MKDTVPPSAVNRYRLPATARKSFIDILAEIDDWYAKELTGLDAWNIPPELLNAESRREIRKIAFSYGLKEAFLLALVTPFIYGVFVGWFNPVPEAEIIGKVLAVFVLGWPYLILITLPTMFAVKVRGTITELLTQNAYICRGVGLIFGTWAIALISIFIERYWDQLFSAKLNLYFPYIDNKIFIIFPEAWLWLLVGAFVSAVIPAIMAIFFPIRAKARWREFQELMRGLEA